MSKRLVLYAGDDKARENGSKSASKRVVKLFPFSRRRRANRETRRNGVEADGEKPFRHADQVWNRAPEERKKFDAYGVSKRPPSAAQQPGKAAVERPSERKRPAGPTRVVDLGGLTPLELKVLVRRRGPGAHRPGGGSEAASRRPRPASSRCLPDFASGEETPHSGYHWDGARGRFMEGWYFKVAAPSGSFAFMYSIENPNSWDPSAGVGAQVMGPKDSYMLQYSKDTRRFWADGKKLELGCAFRLRESGPYPSGMSEKGDFERRVERGFQVSSSWHQGHLTLESRGVGGHIEPSVSECSWAYETRRVHGWGNSTGRQQATAGLLAALPVFEPHWQILMSHGLSSGWIKWGDELHEFKDAPSYSEKNWGEGFPKRWFWLQCNTFGDEECTSLTAGGGRRTLPFLFGQDEDVALIGIHHAGRFIEIVPWNGEVSWKVSPWGSWAVKGRSGRIRVELEATTRSSGTVLRAPTVEGLIPVCKDTFEGSLRMRVWEDGELIIDRKSETAALEVGGGPWWDTWVGDAEMKEPLRSLTSGLTDFEAPLM